MNDQPRSRLLQSLHESKAFTLGVLLGIILSNCNMTVTTKDGRTSVVYGDAQE